MKKVALSGTLGLLLAICFHAVPAQAQLRESWVSSTGTDASDCSRATPCGSFQGAHNKTNSGGSINCVDAGEYGGIAPGNVVTISKSITIDCGGTVGLLSRGTSPAFNISGAGIVVKLRHISMQGNFGASAGINFINGAVLYVENCMINNFNGGAGQGIRFAPPTGVNAYLFVSDSFITNNGLPSTGGGIVIQPEGTGTARVMLDRVRVEGNTFGIAVDGTGSSAGINLTISDSVTAGNLNDGIIAVTPGGGAPIGVTVKNTRSVNNGFGFRAIGNNVTFRIDGSTVIGNGTGLSFSGGGALLSAGNNMIQANGTNGAFSGSVALQ